MNTATADDTGVLPVPTVRTVDPELRAELRRDLTSAAWLMAVVTVPGLAVLAALVV